MPDDALLSSPALMLEISRLAPPGYRSHRRRRFYPYGERRAFYFHMGADEESAPEQSLVAVAPTSSAILEPFSQGTFNSDSDIAPALAENVQAVDNDRGGGVVIWIIDRTHALHDWLRGLDFSFFKRNERTGIGGTI